MLVAEWTNPVTTFYFLSHKATCSHWDPYVRAERGWGNGGRSCGDEGAPSLVPPEQRPRWQQLQICPRNAAGSEPFAPGELPRTGVGKPGCWRFSWADERPAGVTPLTQLTAMCPRLGQP